MINLKPRTALLLNDSASIPGKTIDLILLLFNLSACALFVIDSYYPETPQWLKVADFTVVSVFLVEYLLRIYSADKRWHYIFSFYGIIDLLSILPSILILDQLRFLRVLKVLRILRFLRFLETEDFFFGRISRFQLQVCRTIFTIMVILFLASGFILMAEAGTTERQIKTFGEAFYFWVSALSTVGFGDFVPVTAMGRTVTVIMILCGAILVPWQAGILVRMLIRGEGRKSPVTCPQCGLTGHDFDASHCKACGAVIFQQYEGDV